MTAWQNAGKPLASVAQWPVEILNWQRVDADVTVLDVRTVSAKGHVPGAMNVPLLQLRESSPDIDREKPVATFCGSGYRASIAAGLLEQRGFRRVVNVPGSWMAWKTAQLPVETTCVQLGHAARRSPDYFSSW